MAVVLGPKAMGVGVARFSHTKESEFTKLRGRALRPQRQGFRAHSQSNCTVEHFQSLYSRRPDQGYGEDEMI